MKKFIYGLKSLFIKPTRKKFIGFAVPAGIMLVLIINHNYMTINHPVKFLLLFWGAIPAYIWFLGFIYREDKKQLDVYTPCEYSENYNYEDKMYDQISHIEKKTTVTNTTITTETVYFKEGSNYIE
jgi:hypothetical protein